MGQLNRGRSLAIFLALGLIFALFGTIAPAALAQKPSRPPQQSTPSGFPLPPPPTSSTEQRTGNGNAFPLPPASGAVSPGNTPGSHPASPADRSSTQTPPILAGAPDLNPARSGSTPGFNEALTTPIPALPIWSERPDSPAQAVAITDEQTFDDIHPQYTAGLTEIEDALTTSVPASGDAALQLEFRQRAALPDIGIAPGDIILGNMSHFPGHAGIFIGRWVDLPQGLQDEFADVLNAVLIRSGDWGLVDSYLVVDSMGGSGVMLRSFVEQFTGYLPTGRPRGNLEAANRWEGQSGGAIAWPDLPDNSPQRWAIVAEALEAARANVPYESGTSFNIPLYGSVSAHMQWATTMRQSDNVSYADLEYGLDCIALVHIVYWRGAGIDLDTSILPWHTPDDLATTALMRGLYRDVDLEPARFDAMTLGKWAITQRDLWVEDNDGRSWLSPAMFALPDAIWRFWPDGERFQLAMHDRIEINPDFWDQQNWRPHLTRNADGTASFTIDMANGSFDVRGTINQDGTARVEISGDMREADIMSPVDSNNDGLPDGGYSMVIEATKVTDMPTPARRQADGITLVAAPLAPRLQPQTPEPLGAQVETFQPDPYAAISGTSVGSSRIAQPPQLSANDLPSMPTASDMAALQTALLGGLSEFGQWIGSRDDVNQQAPWENGRQEHIRWMRGIMGQPGIFYEHYGFAMTTQRIGKTGTVRGSNIGGGLVQ